MVSWLLTFVKKLSNYCFYAKHQQRKSAEAPAALTLAFVLTSTSSGETVEDLWSSVHVWRQLLKVVQSVLGIRGLANLSRIIHVSILHFFSVNFFFEDQCPWFLHQYPSYTWACGMLVLADTVWSHRHSQTSEKELLFCFFLLTMSYLLSSSDVVDDDDEGISADTVLVCIIRFITKQ